jgi:uncharacterized protein YhaN
VIDLPANFEARLREALETKRNSTEVSNRSAQEQKALRERLDDLKLDVEIAAQREAIEQLKEGLGTYKSAANDLPRRELERKHLEEELIQGMGDLRPDLERDGLDELRAPIGRRREIQDLTNEHGALQARIEAASEALREERDKLTTAQTQRDNLPPPRDASSLRRALDAARSLGDIDSRLGEAQRLLEAETRECERGVSALGLWSGTQEELERLPVPQLETIERFENEFGSLATRETRLSELTEKAEANIREYNLRLETLRRSGAAPMEAELEAEREQRDAGWRLVRRRWIEGEPVDEEIAAFTPDEPLPDLYERSVTKADDVADRLRREADRVAEQAALEAQRQQAEETKATVQRDLTGLRGESDELKDGWNAIWRPAAIEPHPPREMLGWLRRQRQLVDAATALRRKRDELEALVAKRAKARTAVLSALRPLGAEVPSNGEELAPVLARADEVVADIETTEASRARLDETLETCEKAVKRATEAAESAEIKRRGWTQEWIRAVAGLGLAEDARPAAALDRLESANGLMECEREIKGIDTRIDGMQRDIEQFRREVDAFIAAHAPELAGQPVEEQVQSLGRSLAEVERQETVRAEITQQLTTLEKRSEEAVQALANADRELESLRELSQAPDDAGLETALSRWQERQQLRSELTVVEQQLADAGAGTPIVQLEAEAEDVDRDSLPGQIEEYVDRVAALEKRRSEVLSVHAAAQAELNRMDGSAEAAEAAVSAQETAARLRRDVERYVRIRLARAILQREIDRYREAHQSPVLLRASKLFGNLTMGSFASLQSDYDDEERPVLIGVRPGERKLQVHEMSSGTRDQLYLALRLATVEEWIDRSGPMPFIVDDILVNFDDERARATLEVLAQLGTLTQVLVFTHHGRDRQHARDLGIPVVDLEAN